MMSLSDRPILIEGLRALDAGHVGPHTEINVVDSIIARQGALVRTSRGRIVGSIRFHDVVLHHGISRPSIDREIAVASCSLVAAVVDDSVAQSQRNIHRLDLVFFIPRTTRILSQHEVARIT